jgi:acetoacetyl-CoA reductase/3-oxoacyl-[acyl-carrier protein] reductase
LGAFDGKVVLVTGAAGGIGAAITRRFASEGASVVAIGHRAASLDALRETLKAAGLSAACVQLDCSDYDAVMAEFARLEDEYGRIDVLVNNIGSSARERAKEFADSTPQLWEDILTVSLRTTMNCCRATAPGMRTRRSGKIVNIASETATYGDYKSGEYAAAKAGVLGLTRVLARELAPYDVNVNAVSPGVVNTSILQNVVKEILDAALAAIPRGRICEPEDIAGVVAFLASDESRGIVGQNIIVNGGRSMQ